MNLAELWPALTVIVAIIGCLSGWIWHIQNQGRDEKAKTATEVAGVRDEIQKTKIEISELEVRISKEYIRLGGLDELRSDFRDLDRKFDTKMDKLRDDIWKTFASRGS